MLTTDGIMALTSARRSRLRFSSPATSFGSTLAVVASEYFSGARREKLQSAILQPVIVKRRNRGADQENKDKKFDQVFH